MADFVADAAQEQATLSSICMGSTPCIAIVDLAALSFAFVALAIVCDDYLVPAIEVLCERWKIPEDAAGASFLAFGSAAPEILVSRPPWH